MRETLNRAQPPAPEKPRPFHFPSFDRFTMDNNLQILVAHNTDIPIVDVHLCIHCSPLCDPADKEGLAFLMAELLTEGTGNRNSEAISNAFEFLGAQYGSFADWNAVHVQFNVSTRHLAEAFEVFADLVQHSTFPIEDFKRIKKETLIDRLRVSDNPAKLAGEGFAQALYNNYRYSLPREGTRETLERISIEDVRAFYAQNMTAKNATLIFAGDITKEKVLALSEKYLGNWPEGDKAQVAPMHFDIPMRNELYLIHKPGAAQTELRMGHLGIDATNAHKHAVSLMNEILGGYFLSRINMNLREEHGYTYGAHSYFASRKRTGPFVIAAAIESRFIAEAIREVFKEVNALRERPVDTETLQNAKGYLMGVFPIVFETVDQIAMALSNITVLDLPDDYYQTYRDKIAALGAHDIQQAAQKYLHPGQMQIVVVGDRTEIEAKLKKDFNVHVLDVNGIAIE
ncbi:MAG: hypothetical protein GF313_10520 [Caldithrix sp.]|nr:hypothetical protein [Caldithrix sp.]